MENSAALICSVSIVSDMGAGEIGAVHTKISSPSPLYILDPHCFLRLMIICFSLLNDKLFCSGWAEILSIEIFFVQSI